MNLTMNMPSKRHERHSIGVGAHDLPNYAPRMALDLIRAEIPLEVFTQETREGKTFHIKMNTKPERLWTWYKPVGAAHWQNISGVMLKDMRAFVANQLKARGLQ